jgi:farnesyl diphosphate synthase
MYDFDAELKDNAAAVERELDRLIGAKTLAGPGMPPDRLIAAMRHGSVNGGKRLRPLLVRQAAAVFGVPPEETLSAGVAVEMVHCYSLIHDDLPAMDNDDLRRGRPTVHKAYDEATAILAGDALLTHAFNVLVTEVHGPGSDKRADLVAILASGAGAGGMVGGQMRDIEGETRPLGDRAIAQMQAMKTGALIRAAVQMGATLGGASPEQVIDLTTYAEKAGAAFQLADDILDVTATTDQLGKATGKDAGAGKQTLVSLIGIAAARRRLGELVHDALTALTPFGPEADGLRATARFFATRES